MQPDPRRSSSPPDQDFRRPPSSNNTVWIVLAVVGGLACIGLLVIVVCLAAIRILGTNANVAFGTVGASIGKTVSGGGPGGGPGRAGLAPAEKAAAEQVARQFLADLDGNRLDAAYQHLSAFRRQIWSLKEFKVDIQASPGLLKQSSYQLRDAEDAGAGRLRFTATVQGEGKLEDYRVQMELIFENGAWKIEIGRAHV